MATLHKMEFRRKIETSENGIVRLSGGRKAGAEDYRGFTTSSDNH